MKKAIAFLVVGGCLLLGFFFQSCARKDDTASSNNSASSNVSAPFVKGQMYGSCLYRYGADFKPTTTPSGTGVVWPMVSCDANGTTTCATGFTPIIDTPVQMNCSLTPKTEMLPCYWMTTRCVSTTGSTLPTDFVRGQMYGSCLYKAGSDFKPLSVPGYVAWPMISCDINGTTACAAGFLPVDDTPVQMNCAGNPTTDMSPCYWRNTRCAKL